MLGLDIGTRYVKAILLENKGEQIEVVALACEPILGDAFAEREIKDFDAVSNAIRKIKHNLKTKIKDVSVAVSGAAVLTKVVHMAPDQTDLELEGQIELEADSLIPFPLEDVYLDFERLGTQTDGRDDVLLSVAHKNMLNSRITLLREVEFEPKVVDIEGYALGNALLQFEPFTDDAAHCCFCIGASQLQLTVIHGGKITYSKELAFGVDNLISDLSILHAMDKQTAAQQLRSGQLPESWKSDTYPQFLGNLQQHINRALQLYNNATNEEIPNSLLLCGGGATIEGLVEDLAADLGARITLFDPLQNLIFAEGLDKSTFHGPQFVIAAGLACRSFNPCHI